MDLSVIIPTYNRAELLPRAIESVLQQSLVGDHTYELIVVDDGSVDSTEKMLKQRYPDLIHIKQNNQGVSAARNAGLKYARGEWIAFLDSDDEWLPDKLQRQFTELEQTGLLICHTEELWVRNGVRVNQMNKHAKHGGDIFEYCLPLCAMSPSSIIIHRSVFAKVGDFDERLPACEDYDLWLRITARYPVAFVKEPCIRKYGGHEDQLSQRYWGMDRFRVIALEKILQLDAAVTRPTDKLTSKKRAAALKMLLSKLNILLIGARKHQNQALIEYCLAQLSKWA